MTTLEQKYRIAFLFPGQGAQSPGMGKTFYDHFSEAKEVYQEADEILQENLSKIIFEGPEDKLTETKNSQVGIFVTSLAMLKVVQKEFPSLVPYVTSGLSLGEITSLVASDRLNFQDGVRFVRERGLAMHQACFDRKGTMAAVLGLSGDEVDAVVKNLGLDGELWVANYNAPGQIVISGTLEGVEKGGEALKAKGAKRMVPLQVFGAFHSGLMDGAAKKLAPTIDRLAFKDSSIRIVMNVPGDFVDQPPLVPKFLKEQVTHSVRWEQGVRAMAKDGVDLFIEMGCGKVLTGLNKKIGVLGKSLSIETVDDLKNLAELMK
jgi:[acyl-carrier-protein] S-malonyltransferase